MRSQFILLLLICSLATVAAAESLPDHCAILPTSEGPALIHQCSRIGPTNVSGYWTPSPSQVIAIEKLLLELLQKSGHKIKLSDSYRQYIGFTTHGKKLIYLNAFPLLHEFRDWQTKAASVCDGGDAFWGVEFDPADNTFHELQFNGLG